MLRSVFAKAVRDQERAVAWWALALVGTVLMYAAVFPTVKGNSAQLDRYLNSFPQALRDLFGGNLGSPAGYMRSELFAFMIPILFLVFGVGAGGRAVAGEEEAGTLDLLLSTPVRRATVVFGKFWGCVTAASALAVATWAAILLLGGPFGLTVPVVNVTAQILTAFLLAVAFGSIALAVGAATGARTVAVGVSSGVALVTFLVNTLAPSMTELKRLRMLSPFYWYTRGDPLTNGPDVTALVVLASIAAVALIGAVVAFERRDLAT